MFNRSEIMKAAWQDYRQACASFTARDRKHSLLAQTCCDFKNCLRKAWKRAKDAIKEAKLKILMVTDSRAVSLANQILILDYKSWTPERAKLKSDLQSQLASLAA